MTTVDNYMHSILHGSRPIYRRGLALCMRIDAGPQEGSL